MPFNLLMKSMLTTALRSAGTVLRSLGLLLCITVAMNAAAQEGGQADREPVMQYTVDINVADAETLALALDGVGISRAHAIVAYREEHGRFTRIEQLQDVSGIGPATFERNRDRLVIETEER